MLQKQRELQQALVSGSKQEAILFCEHTPILTYGSSSELHKVLLASPLELERAGIKLSKTDRGGNITYHGPGQLVCYLILDLKKRKQDVSWYLRSLEQAVIELLSSYEVVAMTMPEQTGVWTSKSQKICSIGVRISRWCCMHGIALNIEQSALQGFKQIVPCGISGAEAVSIQDFTDLIPDRPVLIERLSKILLKRFYTDFHLAVAVH